MKFVPSPAQRVMCLVCFEGWDPKDFDGEDRELARQLFGSVEEISPAARSVVAILAGRSSGKSLICGLRMLHLALTHPLKRLAAGQIAFGVIVAPDRSTAELALNYISGAARECPDIACMISKDNVGWLTLRRPDGKNIVMMTRAATKGGRSVRGRTFFAALMDECCFFDSSDFAVNDTDIFDAIMPRLLIDAQMLLPSTPWTEEGLLYRTWSENRETSRDAISVHAKTTVMQPEMIPKVEAMRLRDPDKAKLEYDAVPLEKGTSVFFDPAAIKAATVQDCQLVLPPTDFPLSTTGIDTGFTRDPSASVSVRKARDGLFDVAEVFEIRVPKGERLKPTETIKLLVERARYHKSGAIIADIHYIESVREQSGGFKLTDAPIDITVPYIATRNALNEGKIRIGACHERLLKQLHETVQKPSSGGKLIITNPRKAGAHGDLVSAFVLAVWAILEGQVSNPKIYPGRPGETGPLTPGSHQYHPDYPNGYPKRGTYGM